MAVKGEFGFKGDYMLKSLFKYVMFALVSFFISNSFMVSIFGAANTVLLAEAASNDVSFIVSILEKAPLAGLLFLMIFRVDKRMGQLEKSNITLAQNIGEFTEEFHKYIEDEQKQRDDRIGSVIASFEKTLSDLCETHKQKGGKR